VDANLVGQVVIPSAVAFGTALAFIASRAKAAGALEERVNAAESHAENVDIHCSPEQHARLARIEERCEAIQQRIDDLFAR
jgi:hypothetical protein